MPHRFLILWIIAINHLFLGNLISFEIISNSGPIVYPQPDPSIPPSAHFSCTITPIMVITIQPLPAGQLPIQISKWSRIQISILM